MTTTEQPGTFTCLPRERYVDDVWFERDLAEVTSRQWLYFCHVSQIPETGDILERELGGESIIATRDGDGVVHAFYNVCRHRGYRLCDAGASSSKQLVCPYHRWSFGLDGALTGAPTLRDGEDFDFGDYGLKRLAVETWCGFVFVALGPEPPRHSLADVLADAGRAFEVYEPERLKLAHEVEYEVECNWKILLENFLECYHCPGSHPEFCLAADVPSFFKTTERGAKHFMMAHEYNWGGFPLRPGVESFTISGERACRLSLGRTNATTSPFSLSIHPTLTALAFVVDYGVVHQFMPISAGRSRWTAHWFVHPDAIDGEDYDVETVIGIWHATNLQDVALCERTQLGVNSRSFTPGPNSPKREPMIRSALAVYHQLLGEAAEFEALTGEPFSDR